MRAAVAERFGEAPTCQEVPDPAPADGQVVARVRAAAIKNIERMLVAGTHYGSRSLPLPARVGVDAVVELPDGRRGYAGATPPAGGMAEQLCVQPERVLEIPAGVTDEAAAAMPNAAASAWFALEYAGRLEEGQRVLVLGATGVTGGLAVQLAKQWFGAGSVVAAGRNTERLHQLLSLGADDTIRLGDGSVTAQVRARHAEQPFDLVLDYLWGGPAEQALRAFGQGDLEAGFHHTRFVQVGEMAGPTIQVSASTLRSAGVEIVGQGAGSVPRDAYARLGTQILPRLFEMMAAGSLVLETVARPLEAVQDAWAEPLRSGQRAVLIPAPSAW